MIKSCPDCSGVLEKGSILDSTYGGINTSMYVENNQADNNSISSYKNTFTNWRKIIAYRCKSCNRIFNYASPTIIKKSSKIINNVYLMVAMILLILIIVGIITFVPYMMIISNP